jgi:hypothetical protein
MGKVDKKASASRITRPDPITRAGRKQRGKKRGGRERGNDENVGIEDILDLSVGTISENIMVFNTRKSYAGYIERGKKWLKAQRKEILDVQKREREMSKAARTTKTKRAVVPRTDGASNDRDDDNDDSDDEAYNPLTDPDFLKSFDKGVRSSPHAIKMYLTNECVKKGLGKSTADSLHAAFKKEFDLKCVPSHVLHTPSSDLRPFHLSTSLPRAGDKYRGRWHYDHDEKCWKGNPIESAEVEDMMKSIKNLTAGDSHKHSAAMSLSDMAKIFEASKRDCPYLANNTGLQLPPPKAEDNIANVTKHLFWLAFSSTGWTLWTR